MRRMIPNRAGSCLNRYLPGTAQRLGSVGLTWRQRLEGERESPTGAEGRPASVLAYTNLASSGIKSPP